MTSAVRVTRVILILLATIASTQSVASAQTLPFELIDNRVFVDVFLNDKGPYKFILDTGAVAAVSDGVARDLKLNVTGGSEDGGVGEKTVRTGRTKLRDVKLGDLELHDVDCGVLSLDDSPAVFGSKPVDGIVGLPVFEARIVTFEYVKREVTLSPPDEFKAPANAIVVPLQRSGHIPVVDGELDGIPARFAIDTGARSSLLVYGPFAQRNHLREKYHATMEGITGWGIGGRVRSLLARAATFKLGGAEVRDIVIRLSTQHSGATTASDIAGLIGPDVLKQFTVTFDYPHSRMLLAKNSNYGHRDTWDRTGMWISADTATAREWRVLDVMANSPAAQAGIHVNDQITHLDGKPVSQLVLPDVRDSFRTRSVGSRIRIDYRRDNETRTTEIILRDIV